MSILLELEQSEADIVLLALHQMALTNGLRKIELAKKLVEIATRLSAVVEAANAEKVEADAV